MIVLFKHRWNRVAVRIAIASFILGTLLMLLALMANNEFIISCGIVFLVFYIPVTLVILFILFINTLTNFKDIQEHIMALVIVLLNLPIALVYLSFLNL